MIRIETLSSIARPDRLALIRPHLHRLPALVGLVTFVIAVFVLHRALANLTLADVTADFRSIPRWQLVGALLLTVASYLLLTFYDIVGLRYVGSTLRWREVAKTSFVAFAVGHNVGIASLSGGAIRYRAYSGAGLSAADITRIVVSCTVTFALGVAALLGAALLFEPGTLLQSVKLPTSLGRILGVLLIGVPIAWIAWSARGRAPLAIGAWRIAPPSLPLAGGQVVLSIIDLIVAAAVLWLLLPANADIGLLPFIGLYVIAMTLGVLSNVPGGIGVFEGLMILLLPSVAPHTLLGVLLAYRVVYYLVPLVLALGLLAAELVDERQSQVRALASQGTLVLTRAAPQILAVMVFLAGAVLLLSGTLPSVNTRLEWLSDLVPDTVMQLSHLIGSAIGLALLIVAHGLHRRLHNAWTLTLWLLCGGVLVSLLKGFDYEEAIVLALAAALLYVSRDRFHRRASLLDEPFTLGWFASVTTVVVGIVWLGLFAYQHVDYSHRLWWNFAYDREAPKMLRASLLVVVLLVAFALTRLLRPTAPRRHGATADELELARRIVGLSGSAEANVALTGDKDFLFHADNDAFVMYSVEGRSAIALGDPVGNRAHLADMAWAFRELCDRLELRCVFYQVTPEHLPLYIDLGLTFSKLGEEARIPLAAFTLEGKRNAEQRQARNKGLREGAEFSIVPAAQLRPLLPELRAVSDDWLANKHVREKGFSIGAFDPDYLCRFDTAVVRREGKVVAFANLWLSGDRSELSIDLMRHSESAPKGIMDFLFVELMLWGKSEGYGVFSLGMAPLSGLEHHPLATLWNRVGNLVFRFGDEFYNFDGLRKYKQKFHPEWEPRYLAAPGGLALPRVLVDATTLISGGVKGVFAR